MKFSHFSFFSCFLIIFVLFSGCQISRSARYIYFINQSGETLQKVEIANLQNQGSHFWKDVENITPDEFEPSVAARENMENGHHFRLDDCQPGLYRITVYGSRYIGSYRIRLTNRNPSITCCLSSDFSLSYAEDQEWYLQPSSAFTKLGQDIDAVLEESRRASERARYEYASLIGDYLPYEARVVLDGKQLMSKEELLANITRFGECEITLDSSLEDTVCREFDQIYARFLILQPKPLQNMLQLNGIPGASEDENYLYFEENAVSKLNFGAASVIKLLCGIPQNADVNTKGYRSDVSPIWDTGYRYAFKKDHFTETEKESFRSQLAEWMGVIYNRTFTTNEIKSEFEIEADSHQYRLWHIGCYYLSMVSKETTTKDYLGLSGFPGKLPWQFIYLYNNNTTDNRTILHEIGHNLGLMHEQQRWDSVNHLLFTESSVQWTRLPGNQTSGYDINSIMHYRSIKVGGKDKSIIYDVNGNNAANSGYLSETDKIFISRLYNPNNSANHYRPSVPIVDRIFIKDQTGSNLDIYSDADFSKLVSLKEDIWLSPGDDLIRGAGNTQGRIKLAEKGFLELPGISIQSANAGNSNSNSNRNRLEYNKNGFGKNDSYNDQIYYVNAGLSEKISLFVKNFEWQTISSSSSYSQYYSGEYVIFNVALTEADNCVVITSQAEGGKSVKYIFHIIKDDQRLKSLRAQVSGKMIEEWDSEELLLTKEFCLNYIYSTYPIEVTIEPKIGQTVSVGNQSFESEKTVSFSLDKGESRKVIISVASKFLNRTEQYTLEIHCLDEVAVPNSLTVTAGKEGTVLLDDHELWKYYNRETPVEVLASLAEEPLSIIFDLKENQKVFYSYDKQIYEEMKQELKIDLQKEFVPLYFRIDYYFSDNLISSFFGLNFEQYKIYQCQVKVNQGGAVKVNDTIVWNNRANSFSFQTNRKYRIQIKAVTGFQPVVNTLLNNTIYPNIYEFKFDKNTDLTFDFEPLYSNQFKYEIDLSPVDSEVIKCGTTITGKDLSVYGNTIYLKAPDSKYTVSILKQEEAKGYMYKNELWLEDGTIVLANKAGIPNNGSVEKSFSGPNLFYRKLYALKAGANLWDVCAPIRIVYIEPVF